MGCFSGTADEKNSGLQVRPSVRLSVCPSVRASGIKLFVRSTVDLSQLSSLSTFALTIRSNLCLKAKDVL